MSINSRHTFKALRSNFELACLYAIGITTADIIWMLHDIWYNGMSIWYFTVLSGLIGGVIGTIIVVIKHNGEVVAQLNHERLLHKIRRLHKIKRVKETTKSVK